MSGVAYYTPDIQESIRQGVSILAIGSSGSLSSCDEAQLQGQTENELSSTWSVCLAFGWSRLG